MGYADAESLLRTLLKDMLEFVGAYKKVGEDGEKKDEGKVQGKVLESIDQSKIDFKNAFPANEQDLYSWRSTMAYKVLYVLILFAEICAAR